MLEREHHYSLQETDNPDLPDVLSLLQNRRLHGDPTIIILMPRPSPFLEFHAVPIILICMEHHMYIMTFVVGTLGIFLV